MGEQFRKVCKSISLRYSFNPKGSDAYKLFDMKEEKQEDLTQKLGEFINVPRTIKTMLSFIGSKELSKSERDDLIIMVSYLIDEHLVAK